MPPRKRTNWPLIIGLIIAGIFCCCVLPAGLIGGGAFFLFGKAKDTVVCGMAFENLHEAILDYAHDHKETLPKAATWMDDVRPYYAKVVAAKGADKSNPFGNMPSEGAYSCTTEGKVTGIAFNQALSGKKLADVRDTDPILIFETNRAELNEAAAYVQGDMDASPKILGKPRGWYTATVNGSTKTGKMKFQTGPAGNPVIEGSNDSSGASK